MTQSKNPPPPTPPPAPADKEKRLADALRANLRRRKGKPDQADA